MSNAKLFYKNTILTACGKYAFSSLTKCYKSCIIVKNVKGKKMEYDVKKDGDTITYVLHGRLDLNTSPQFLAAMNLNGAKNLVFDLADVDYIFSAGLRVFLQAQKEINAKQGSMKIINTQSQVKEIFDIVGFSSIMDIA